MSTITVKGQVTVPKPIREALGLTPGVRVEFTVNADGQVVLTRAGLSEHRRNDRFGAARGKADIAWRTDELMELLRGE